jgi:hypothetical protein
VQPGGARNGLEQWSAWACTGICLVCCEQKALRMPSIKLTAASTLHASELWCNQVLHTHALTNRLQYPKTMAGTLQSPPVEVTQCTQYAAAQLMLCLLLPPCRFMAVASHLINCYKGSGKTPCYTVQGYRPLSGFHYLYLDTCSLALERSLCSHPFALLSTS